MVNSRKRQIAIIDCNNFFVSVERLFRPDLMTRPVIVASSNDGNVVSRSDEAKALNVKMGVPIFQIRDLILKHKIEVFSSNFALYSDISNRVYSVLRDHSPIQENYSIDPMPKTDIDVLGLVSSPMNRP